MLGDIAGLGPVRDALLHTNALLEQVLEELRATNQRQLTEVVDQMRSLNEKLDALAASGVEPPEAT